MAGSGDGVGCGPPGAWDWGAVWRQPQGVFTRGHRGKVISNYNTLKGSVADPLWFNADPDPAFTSMRIRIQEAKPMRIQADPDPSSDFAVTKSWSLT